MTWSNLLSDSNSLQERREKTGVSLALFRSLQAAYTDRHGPIHSIREFFPHPIRQAIHQSIRSTSKNPKPLHRRLPCQPILYSPPNHQSLTSLAWSHTCRTVFTFPQAKPVIIPANHRDM